MMKTSYKAVGGVEHVALYPADAVEMALFSSEGCEVTLDCSPIEVLLVDDSSHYEEEATCREGAALVTHRLHLVADRGAAEQWLEQAFLERAAEEGLVAVVTLCDGRTLLVGYSARFGNEQPLRLDSLTSSSGDGPHDSPRVTLQLRSYDTDFSTELI
jgi:hypothetical protein